MKIKHLLSLFIFAFLITIVGALFKLMHWPGASTLLIIGTFIKVISGVILIIKLLTNNKFKEFLNW